MPYVCGDECVSSLNLFINVFPKCPLQPSEKIVCLACNSIPCSKFGPSDPSFNLPISHVATPTTLSLSSNKISDAEKPG